MGNLGFYALIVVFVVCLNIRWFYEIRLTKRIFDNKPAFKELYMAVLMFILWPSWFILCEIDPYVLSIPLWLRWTGFGLFIIGTIFFIWPVIQFRGFLGPDHLVKTGLFKYTRHPMYVGFFAWLIGYPLFQESLIMLLTSPIWIFNVFFWRFHEEKRLAFLYEEYRKYQKESWF